MEDFDMRGYFWFCIEVWFDFFFKILNGNFLIIVEYLIMIFRIF